MELDRSALEQTADKPGALIEVAFIVVVARRAFLVEILLRGSFVDRLDPLRFGLGRRLEAPRLMQLRMLNDIRDMRRLLIQHMGEVRRQRILRDAHVEAVRKTGAVETVQRFEPVLPMLSERFAATAVDLEARATG